MSILLINPPFCSSSSSDDLFPPLGLACIAAVIREKGHNVSIFDASINKKQKVRKIGRGYWYGKNWEEIKEEIRKYKFDAVGIGCFFSMRFPYALNVAKIIKKIDKNIPIIIGGIHATAEPREVLKNKEIDYVVIGEGEQTIIDLIKAMHKNSKKDLKKIDGLGYKINGKILINPKTRYIHDLDSLPLPARDLLDMEYYIASKGFRWDLGDKKQTSVITSRGCPNRCTFCNMHMINGRIYRGRSAKNVVDEIEELIKQYGIEELSFEDDNLTFDRERILNICKEIISRGIKIKWNTPNGVSAKVLDEEVLRYMKKSGCVSINLGIESGDPVILNKVIKKGLSLEKVKEVVWLCKKIGLIVNGYFIIGMPGETKESINNSIKFANSIPLDKIALFFATPFPGTELYEQCLKNKYISEDYHQQITHKSFILFDKPLIETPLMSKEELLKARRKFFLSFLMNKFRKNKREFFFLPISFIKNPGFRKKVFVAIKRYIMGR